MAAATHPGLRRGVVVVLIVALTLAGLGRGVAAASVPAPATIAGAQVPICHSGASSAPEAPARGVAHDCCDDCALLAAAVIPAPPSLSRPTGAARPAPPARGSAWILAAAPSRGHSLPRGPPAA